MLGAIERGDRNPSLKLAKRIADYYGTTVEDIFFNQKGNDLCPLDKNYSIKFKRSVKNET